MCQRQPALNSPTNLHCGRSRVSYDPRFFLRPAERLAETGNGWLKSANCNHLRRQDRWQARWQASRSVCASNDAARDLAGCWLLQAESTELSPVE